MNFNPPTVSVLLVTHHEVGKALLYAAQQTFGELPLRAEAAPVDDHLDPEHLFPLLQQMTKNLDQGKGVLILTDALGATPSNLAQQLQHDIPLTQIVTGLNLPMLLRIMNYPHLNLCELAEKALSGGREGICSCGTTHPETADAH